MALQRPVVAHHLDGDRLADAQGAQLGLLEIALDPERAAVDQRQHRLAGRDVVAGAQGEVRQEAVGRRGHDGALQVQRRHVAGRLGLGQGRLALLDLGQALLGDFAGHQIAERAVAGQLAAGLGQHHALGLDRGVGLAQGQGVTLAVDIEQRLAGLDRLVVDGVDAGDQARNVGSHLYDVGADAAVAGPGIDLVVGPQRLAADQGGDDDGAGDGDASGGEQNGLQRGHDYSFSGDGTVTTTAQRMTNRAVSNSAGCQTKR